MERNNLMSCNYKHQSIHRERSLREDDDEDNNKMKESWKNFSTINSSSTTFVGGDLFSWPPRSYTCSFCKREFRSAQALGGHMNVHRRDRARLRQSPPRNGQFSIYNLNLDLNKNPNPTIYNPNPNFSSSSTSPTSSILFHQPFTSSMPPLVSPSFSLSNSPSSASRSVEIKKWSRDVPSMDEHLSPRAKDDHLKKVKTTKTLFGVGKLDGFFQGKDQSDVVKKAEILRLNLEIGLLSDSKNDLDLELRLGYS